MPLRATSGTVPAWDDLNLHARGQAGYFTTQEAAEHHIGTALLTHHVRSGRLEHVGRRIFRFAQYPPMPRDELVPLWLWSDRHGVFSHETALSLLAESDLSPTHVDMTLPASWRRRRLKLPSPALVLHFQNIPKGDRAEWGPILCTSLVRTLNDCAEAGTEEQYLEQAVRRAVKSGKLLPVDFRRLTTQLRRWLPRSKQRRA
jgi:predicted transcriptional regulator of viral defense system